jgi:hypothetical protein
MRSSASRWRSMSPIELPSIVRISPVESMVTVVRCTVRVSAMTL